MALSAMLPHAAADVQSLEASWLDKARKQQAKDLIVALANNASTPSASVSAHTAAAKLSRTTTRMLIYCGRHTCDTDSALSSSTPSLLMARFRTCSLLTAESVGSQGAWYAPGLPPPLLRECCTALWSHESLAKPLLLLTSSVAASGSPSRRYSASRNGTLQGMWPATAWSGVTPTWSPCYREPPLICLSTAALRWRSRAFPRSCSGE